MPESRKNDVCPSVFQYRVSTTWEGRTCPLVLRSGVLGRSRVPPVGGEGELGLEGWSRGGWCRSPELDFGTFDRTLGLGRRAQGRSRTPLPWTSPTPPWAPSLRHHQHPFDNPDTPFDTPALCPFGHPNTPLTAYNRPQGALYRFSRRPPVRPRLPPRCPQRILHDTPQGSSPTPSTHPNVPLVGTPRPAPKGPRHAPKAPHRALPSPPSAPPSPPGSPLAPPRTPLCRPNRPKYRPIGPTHRPTLPPDQPPPSSTSSPHRAPSIAPSHRPTIPFHRPIGPLIAPPYRPIGPPLPPQDTAPLPSSIAQNAPLPTRAIDQNGSSIALLDPPLTCHQPFWSTKAVDQRPPDTRKR